MSPLRFRYQTLEFGDIDIHVRTLRDKQQFNDDGGKAELLGISSAIWPLFGVIWDSSSVLAHYMLQYECGNKRILEMGCGIALTSLLLNVRHADISATDYHPEVEGFLFENVRLNQGRTIPFERCDWADGASRLGLFDVLIGSDLLYHRSHVDVLSHFIQQHAQAECEVIMVDPGRGHHACFSKKMISLGYTHSQHKPCHTGYLAEPFRGQILRYQR